MISEKRIAAIAAQCDVSRQHPPQVPLTQAERQEILQEVTDMCQEQGTLIGKLRDAPDAYLCMALCTAWSMRYCQKATGRTPGERNRTVLYPTED